MFDGAGHEFEAVLDEVRAARSPPACCTPSPPGPSRRCAWCLAMAALKGDRMELVLQKATELGVAEIWPVVTFRTDAAARPALEGSRSERWERVASGAAEQCGRAIVPHVAPTRPCEAWSRDPWTERARHCSRPPVTRRLPSLPIDPALPLLLLVGPAGGFEAAEARRCVRPASSPPRSARASSAPRPPRSPRSRSRRPSGATCEPALPAPEPS